MNAQEAGLPTGGVATQLQSALTPEEQRVEAAQQCDNELAVEQRQVSAGRGAGARCVLEGSLHAMQPQHPAVHRLLLRLRQEVWQAVGHQLQWCCNASLRRSCMQHTTTQHTHNPLTSGDSKQRGVPCSDARPACSSLTPRARAPARWGAEVADRMVPVAPPPLPAAPLA